MLALTLVSSGLGLDLAHFGRLESAYDKMLITAVFGFRYLSVSTFSALDALLDGLSQSIIT